MARKIALFLFVLGIITCQMSMAQENTESNGFALSTDLVSLYMWRGSVADSKPNLQPELSYTWKNFSIGAFGSANFDNSYREFDLFASYKFKKFTFTLNDYYWSPFIDSLKYFNYDFITSGHYLEGQLSWDGPEAFPVNIQAATIFFGPDNKFDHFDSVTGETTYVNRYSTYFEVGYPFTVKDYELKAFIGGTPAEGMFGKKAAIVNMGLTAVRKIKVSPTFEIPVTANIIFNPETSKMYFTLGITL